MGLFRFFKKKRLKNESNDSLNKNIKEKEIIENKNLELKDIKNEKNIDKNNTVISKIQCLFTPNRIDKLEFNEVFVFGSNLEGQHGGGAARTALNKFGAINGQGTGLQGQSYGIPTMHGGTETIVPYADEFINFAIKHPKKFFYVTRIGCGIAGFKDEEIAPLFKKALDLNNVYLPKSFVRIINNKPVRESYKLKEYGQVRTLADIVKALNNKNKYTDLNSLLNDFYKIIDRYKRRGTITTETIALIDSILFMRESDLFIHNEFDVNYFEKLLANNQYINKTIEDIFEVRATTKIISIIKYLNSKKRYTSSKQIINDIQKLSKRQSLFNDSFSYPLYFLEEGLKNSWSKMTKDDKLDNILMEKVMFNDHTMKVKKLGLDKVIEMDYRQGGCHTDTYTPNEIGLGPVYLKHKNGTYMKSCGEGAGPNSVPDFYEEQLLRYLTGC